MANNTLNYSGDKELIYNNWYQQKSRPCTMVTLANLKRPFML